MSISYVDFEILMLGLVNFVFVNWLRRILLCRAYWGNPEIDNQQTCLQLLQAYPYVMKTRS